MLKVRKSAERGHANHGWLDTYHSFSFAGYYDPRFMGWGNLRVINEDRVAPGTGFGMHGHRDMEIITYIKSGELAHRDTLGNVETIPAGDVQRMSAGTGIRHSEFNHMPDQEVHLFQIWIEPSATGIEPGYEQQSFASDSRHGALRLLVSPDGREGSMRMHADASLYMARLKSGDQIVQALNPSRKAYLHLMSGGLTVNGISLSAGDAVMVADETQLKLDGVAGEEPAEILLFDLAAA